MKKRDPRQLSQAVVVRITAVPLDGGRGLSMMDIRHVVAAVLFLVKGICELLNDSRDFADMEEGVRRLVQKAGQDVFVWALEELDERLMRERDKANLDEVKFCERTWVSTFGSMTVRRRQYRDRRTEEYRFLLDEALGWEPNKRLTDRMEEIALVLGTETSFRQAAKLIECLTPGVSPMAVWGVAKDAGEKAATQARQERERVFERGEVPQGSRQVEKLRIEGDGVVVALQRSDKRHEEIKLVVGYEGKTGGVRRSLKNRRAVAGVGSGKEIWEEAGVKFGKTWDLGSVKEVDVGGDGAEWIREGAELFGGEYHLDPFHLRKRLTEALSFDPDVYEAVSSAIAVLDRAAVEEALDLAAKRVRGKVRRRVSAIRDYLLTNWDGLEALSEEDRLGAIEGQVRHTIARRMKRIGARWTREGADRMARLLAAKSNGELLSYLGRKKTQDPESRTLPTVEIGRMSAKAEDVEAWLRAKVPALTGPF
ncbi:MAG: ISLre2 family transposase, partial [Bacillota bacterium]